MTVNPPELPPVSGPLTGQEVQPSVAPAPRQNRLITELLRGNVVTTVLAIVLSMVIGGILKDRGMISFSRYYNDQDAEALRAYVADRARVLKQQEAAAGRFNPLGSPCLLGFILHREFNKLNGGVSIKPRHHFVDTNSGISCPHFLKKQAGEYQNGKQAGAVHDGRCSGRSGWNTCGRLQ